MKKVLLGGTAFVVAALIGAMPASAADAANVTSVSQLKISGFVGSQATLSLVTARTTSSPATTTSRPTRG